MHIMQNSIFSQMSHFSNLNKYVLIHKNVYAIAFLIVSIVASAQVKFEKNLAGAFEKAQIENKPVFIEYYNSDCSVCKRLQTLLSDDVVVSEHYNANFVNYAINTYNELSADEKQLLSDANLTFDSVPVLLFFDKNKKFLHYNIGDVSANAVITDAKKALLSDYNAAGLQNKYDSGDRTVRTLYAYSNLLVIRRNQDVLTQVNQQLFESFNKAELPTKKSYLVLKRVVNSTENGFFQFWINNLDALKDFETGPYAGTEHSYLSKIVLTELAAPNVKSWDNSKKDTFRSYISKLKITENPEVFFE